MLHIVRTILSYIIQRCWTSTTYLSRVCLRLPGVDCFLIITYRFTRAIKYTFTFPWIMINMMETTTTERPCVRHGKMFATYSIKSEQTRLILQVLDGFARISTDNNCYTETIPTEISFCWRWQIKVLLKWSATSLEIQQRPLSPG